MAYAPMVRLEMPIKFTTGETFMKGTILRWNEELKAYQLKPKQTVLMTIFKDSIEKYPEIVKPVENE